MSEARRPSSWSSYSAWLLPTLVAAVLVLAAALRLWALAGPALWCDEGNNAYFALHSPTDLLEMTRLTNDTDPPAHRLALGLWLRLVGASAYNLRLFSVLLGVATVALVYAWGRWADGEHVGLLAALLMALSPLAVYYSREAKGYPFATFFGLLAVYLWERYLQGQERAHCGLWVAYVLSCTFSVGAHYYAVFLIAAQGMWLAWGLLPAGPGRAAAWARMRRWLLAQAVVAALLLPWVLLTWSTAVSGAKGVSAAGSGPLGLGAYLGEMSLGLAAGPIARNWAAFLAAGALAAAMLWGLMRGQSARTGALGTMVFVPVALSFFSQAHLDFFSARFLLYVSGPLFILVAHGLLRQRQVGVVLGVLLALAWAVTLPSAYTPRESEGDLRPLAQILSEKAEPGDGVLVGYIWQEGILRLYAPHAPVHYSLDRFAAEKREGEMLRLFANHPRLWLVTYGAPLQHEAGNPTGWWLEQHAARALVAEEAQERAVLYLPCPAAGSPQERITFEQRITLTYTPLSQIALTGRALLVTLHWEVSAPLSQTYGVFVHLMDMAETKVWAQHDGDPVNSTRSFLSLVPGEPVTDCHVLWLPGDMPPGDYKVVTGLYRRDTVERLSAVHGPEPGASRCVVGQVHVLPQ